MNAAIRTLLLSVVGLAMSASPALSRDPEPAAKGQAELQGTWKLTSVEADETATDPIGGKPTLVIKGDKLFYGGEELARLTIDASTSPKIIDLKFRDPELTYEGVYVVEDGKLKVCLNRQAEGKKDRPGKLSTKDQPDWRLLIFEKQKEGASATDGLAGYVGMALMADPDNKSVVVKAAIKGAPADKAGVKKDDVVLKVAGEAVADVQGAIEAVRAVKPGANLDLRIQRDGKESTITVKVGVLPFNIVAGLG